MRTLAGKMPPARGGGRFTLIQLIGAGGMGEVFEAIDEDGGGRVALKTLLEVDARSLTRFKHEFRAVRDLRHPGLIAMHELVSDDDGWFFTMEKIDGMSLAAHLRPADAPPVIERTVTGTTAENVLERAGFDPIAAAAAIAGTGGAVDDGRIRDALAQLCDALAHLHTAGKVHRDIKPSNVLVERGGRVVVLDLGLVSDDDRIVDRSGSVAYMAPEQIARTRLTTAADLYAVGVILHEVLTGQLPFAGTRAEVFESKLRADRPYLEPLRAAARGEDRRAALVTLCEELLSLDPAARPSAAEVRRRLGGAPGRRAIAPLRRGPALVGRVDELAALAAALAEVGAGMPVAAVITGEAGIGKTALVGAFTAEAARAGAIVLSARCSERELVPFRAVDGAIDQLTEHLAVVGDDARRALAPADAGLLIQTFPVLARGLDAPAAAAIASPRERRTRMFEAFRELLAGVAGLAPCALVIDDAHWADADSVALLAHALRAPSPPLLVVLTCRDDAPALLTAVAGLPIRTIALGGLSPEAARTLALDLLARDGHAEPAASIERIAAESGGHPLFLEELALRSDGGGAGLTQLLAASVDGLPAAERRVLELVAVAGSPLRREVLADAARASGDPIPALGTVLHGLRAQRLIASTETGDGRMVHAYHARIRDVVLDQLAPPARRACHRELAAALERHAVADSEALATHWEAAGEPGAAVIHAERAADQAIAALAFERAARWYRRAATLAAGAGAPSPRIAQLERSLGEALINAGRGAEGARAFLDAAARTPGADLDRAELRRRAAEQLLLTGHIDEGLELLRAELRAAGLPAPAGPRGALISLGLRRAQVFLRGSEERSRTATARASDLRRIDLCWTVAHGLSLVDTVAGADFQSRHLLLALRGGDPYRAARALSLEAGYLAVMRGSEDRSRRTLEAARRAAERSGAPHAAALVAVSSCVSAFFRGRYVEAVAHGRDAETQLLERCHGSAWELGIARHHAVLALIYMGEMREVRARLAWLIADARDRGDRYGEIYLRTGAAPFLHLADDDPEACCRASIDAAAEWAQPRWRVQIYANLMAVGQGEIHAGRGAAALAAVHRAWPELARAMLLDVALVRIEVLRLRARAALTVAAESAGATRWRHLATAWRDARRIAAEGGIPAEPFAMLLRAGVAALRGAPERALDWLTIAERGFTAADMGLMAAVTRRSRGLLLGGAAGATLVAAADAWMRAQTIVSPVRMAATLAPGLGHRYR